MLSQPIRWKFGKEPERATQCERGGIKAAGHTIRVNKLPRRGRRRQQGALIIFWRQERSNMKFKCPHCGFEGFQLMATADGKSEAQCLSCGKASPFEPEVKLVPSTPEAGPAPE